MQGHKIEFNVFAESQMEADAVSKTIGDFVNDCARNGIAVTANKLLAILSKWGSSTIVRNYFK